MPGRRSIRMLHLSPFAIHACSAALLAVLISAGSGLQAGETVGLKIAGDWQVEVTVASPSGGKPIAATVTVPPPNIVEVKAEKYDRLPLFDAKAAGWRRGVALRGVLAQECSATGLLDAASVQVRGVSQDNPQSYQRGKDYEIDPQWGTFGRLSQGRISAQDTVAITYRHALLRLDSIVLDAGGQIVLRTGTPHAAAPLPPQVQDSERRLANVWVPGTIERITPDHLFPILETTLPASLEPSPLPAEQLLPKTMTKLREGQGLRILAWGDSVTVGTYLPDPDRQRWQEQFVSRLRAAFPKAKIELITEAWGGRNTSSYLAEPPGSEHNYQEKVLGARPDLIVSEFVNDAGLGPAQVEERYSRLLADFQGIGAEWIILTPHYVRPDWMGLSREQQIDEDPRPYVAGLRQFSARHQVALADASLRWGRLWRQGLPYRTLLLNGINHPDARGMKLFADSLMALFP